ncbi:MAG: hypothetical protein H8E17_05105 [Deltaproteobacteria bacterium]|nr:hypothetical protein [Deltaproteobacteria bacterium]
MSIYSKRSISIIYQITRCSTTIYGDVLMADKTTWAEWLDYRKQLKAAVGDDEREKIEKEFHVKYPPAADPDDDTVMLAGMPTEL